MDIFVGNLAFSVTGDDLRGAFVPYGQVTSARVVQDRDTGRSKGFGFVEMPNTPEAETAINALNGKDMQGRNLTVNQARPKEPRTGGGQGRSSSPRW